MHLNYRGIVTRRYREKLGLRYVLEQWSFEAWTVYPEQAEAVRRVTEAECHVSVGPFDRDMFLSHPDWKAILERPSFDAARGGIFVWTSSPFLSQINLSVEIGEGGSYPSEINESLQSEHLGVGLDIELLFSMVENNQLMENPVTFEQFVNGTPLWLDGIPEFSLLRRATA